MTQAAVADPVFEPDRATEEGTLAKAEALAFGAGIDLEKDSAARDHRRKHAFRDQVNRAAIILFWAVVGCVCLGVLVYTWHLLTPEAWHFMSEAALNKLETLLGAAILSSALTNYASRQMD